MASFTAAVWASPMATPRPPTPIFRKLAELVPAPLAQRASGCSARPAARASRTQVFDFPTLFIPVAPMLSHHQKFSGLGLLGVLDAVEKNVAAQGAAVVVGDV